MPQTFLTVKSAAQLYGVCERTIRRRIATGDLRAVRLGGRAIRIPAAEVEQLARPVPTDTEAHARLIAHVANVVADWPPLTPEQIDRVAVLLRPVEVTA